MEPASTLPTLLMWAWLVPLISFVFILFFGKHMGSHGKFAGYLATGAIVTSTLLSFIALFGVWLPNHELPEPAHHEEHAEAADHHAQFTSPGKSPFQTVALFDEKEPHDAGDAEHHSADEHANNAPPKYYTHDWYNLAVFGKLKLSIGCYIDSLTVAMFCMVSLIASCVHFYAMGYMHDELHDFTDPEVTLSNGENLKRPGRYYRFFQYLSLFCFSMLGIVIAGNIAMVFVFWELVGICSYFLIGFYIERNSASTAANKAFIVNRVGDFGMLIGMMALWSSLGTFSFGDTKDVDGNVTEQGIFSLLRTEENDYRLQPHRRHGRRGQTPHTHRRRIHFSGRGVLASARPMAPPDRRRRHLLRLRRQECPIPAARLVARRHGRSHAGLRFGSLGDDGRGGRLFGRGVSSPSFRPKHCW